MKPSPGESASDNIRVQAPSGRLLSPATNSITNKLQPDSVISQEPPDTPPGFTHTQRGMPAYQSLISSYRPSPPLIARTE